SGKNRSLPVNARRIARGQASRGAVSRISSGMRRRFVGRGPVLTAGIHGAVAPDPTGGKERGAPTTGRPGLLAPASGCMVQAAAHNAAQAAPHPWRYPNELGRVFRRGQEGRAMSLANGVLAMPYPGLRPFEAEDQPLFFGREAQVSAMLMQLEDHRFV